VEIDNQTGNAWSGDLDLEITALETTVHLASEPLSVGSGTTTSVPFTWVSPTTDFRGYHVEVRAGSTDQATTATDVSSDWRRYPRYGYTVGLPARSSHFAQTPH
jgi:hypothetical protein